MAANPRLESPVPLRPRQEEAYREVGLALKRRGIQRQLLQIPTGVGKTILACHIAARFNRALFLVHREELVKQTVETFDRVDPWRGVGVVRGRRMEIDQPVTVAMVQTMHARLDRIAADAFDLVVVDECFPAGTKVGGKPIQYIRPGDEVTAFDEKSETFSRRQVSRVMSRPAPASMVRIGTERYGFVCTPQHPIWTRDRGWVDAQYITAEDRILRRRHAVTRKQRWYRVHNAELLHRDRTPNFHWLCPDGQVYNLEVAGVPTYTANNFVVHNCHHAGSRTWREVLDHFEPELRLGLSATPERSDGAPLSNLFDEITYKMTVKEAVAEGYLCRPVGLVIHTDVDLSAVRRVAGDFNEKQLAAAVDIRERNEMVARAYLEHLAGRRTVAFCVTVAHAQHLAEELGNRGVRAEWVSGDDSERAAKLDRLRAGHYDVICNSMLLTEGFDDPAISGIMMCRPTQSNVLYTQSVGRGLRLHDEKDDCLVLDFVDRCRQHSLMTVWDFWGKKVKPEEGEGATPRRVDFLGEDEADEESGLADAQLRFAEIAELSLNAHVYAEMIDLLRPPPEDPAGSFNYGDARWHYHPATDKQLAALERAGYDIDGQDWTKGQVAQMLDAQPASPSQRKLLLAMGYDVLTQDWTRTQAGAALDAAKEACTRPDWRLLNRLGGRP